MFTLSHQPRPQLVGESSDYPARCINPNQLLRHCFRRRAGNRASFIHDLHLGEQALLPQNTSHDQMVRPLRLVPTTAISLDQRTMGWVTGNAIDDDEQPPGRLHHPLQRFC